jgi:hypothetical protein
METKPTPKKPKTVTYSRLPEDTHADENDDRMPYVSSQNVSMSRER